MIPRLYLCQVGNAMHQGTSILVQFHAENLPRITSLPASGMNNSAMMNAQSSLIRGTEHAFMVLFSGRSRMSHCPVDWRWEQYRLFSTP